MRITAIIGSRNKDGQTAISTQALLDGASKQGATFETVFLTDSNMSRCRQCNEDGWGNCRHEGKCIIEDDFQNIVESIRKSDAVVFATPVYYGDLSESMRAFLERLRRTCISEAGRKGVGGTPAVGICLAGGSGGGATGCTHSLEMMMSHCGFEIADMIPVKRQNFTMKQKVLNTVGNWLVEIKKSV
ncbi:MAG: flavodoxin family protein [Armatimonadota bacterium]